MHYMHIITLFWILIAIVTFFLLIKVTAPFGRHTQNGWGVLIDNKMGWIFMEIVSPIALIISYFIFFEKGSQISYFLITLWVLHYINRSLVFPFRINTKGKKMPISIMLSAIGFNIVNGTINGYFLAKSPIDLNIFFGIGFIIFIVGFITNNWADTKLINLRGPNETGYTIPKGGLFNSISCPNLFGEIIEWIGYALMAQNLGAISFVIWTIANLAPRALAHHKWYLEKFEDYPKDRKALIPLVI